MPENRTKNTARQKADHCVSGVTAAHKRTLVFRLLIMVLAASVLFVMYGPWKKLSDLYITTAMHTSEHKWLASMFYSEEYIEKVLMRNAVKQSEGVSARTPDSAADDPGLEFIELSDSGISGYLIIAPSSDHLRFVFSSDEKKGQLLEGLASGYRARAAINASGYSSTGKKGVCWGFTVHNGEVIGDAPGEGLHSFAALDYDNKLFFGRLTADEILERGYRDVIEFGPLLLLDGERADISGNGGGLSPRTVIGQTADGKVLLMVLEGRSLQTLGASYSDVQDIMLQYGAVNALNLDGGYSSAMYYNGGLVAAPVGSVADRMLPNAIIIV